MAGWHEYGYFPPSVARKAKGGIKARSRRGAFAASWWAKRWIATLESFPIGARLGRGRAYARKGQVLDLEIGKGKATARVQGSRRRPYAVTVAVRPIAARAWKRIARDAADNLLVAASLMAGDMPPEIEDLFAAAGAPLFPATEKDLTTTCSCPDWSNPCKHVAAVYYLLAEEFDRDPFLLFRLRGKERDGFVALLGFDMASGGETASAAAASPAEPLTADPDAFWSRPEGDALLAGLAIPEHPTPMADHLGGFPFWRGEEDFATTVSEVSARAAPHGLRAFLGDWRPAPR